MSVDETVIIRLRLKEFDSEKFITKLHRSGKLILNRYFKEKNLFDIDEITIKELSNTKVFITIKNISDNTLKKLNKYLGKTANKISFYGRDERLDKKIKGKKSTIKISAPAKKISLKEYTTKKNFIETYSKSLRKYEFLTAEGLSEKDFNLISKNLRKYSNKIRCNISSYPIEISTNEDIKKYANYFKNNKGDLKVNLSEGKTKSLGVSMHLNKDFSKSSFLQLQINPYQIKYYSDPYENKIYEISKQNKENLKVFLKFLIKICEYLKIEKGNGGVVGFGPKGYSPDINLLNDFIIITEKEVKEKGERKIKDLKIPFKHKLSNGSYILMFDYPSDYSNYELKEIFLGRKRSPLIKNRSLKKFTENLRYSWRVRKFLNYLSKKPAKEREKILEGLEKVSSTFMKEEKVQKKFKKKLRKK